jgi:hypothetical protein
VFGVAVRAVDWVPVRLARRLAQLIRGILAAFGVFGALEVDALRSVSSYLTTKKWTSALNQGNISFV